MLSVGLFARVRVFVGGGWRWSRLIGMGMFLALHAATTLGRQRRKKAACYHIYSLLFIPGGKRRHAVYWARSESERRIHDASGVEATGVQFVHNAFPALNLVTSTIIAAKQIHEHM